MPNPLGSFSLKYIPFSLGPLVTILRCSRGGQRLSTPVNALPCPSQQSPFIGEHAISHLGNSLPRTSDLGESQLTQLQPTSRSRQLQIPPALVSPGVVANSNVLVVLARR